MHLCKTIGLPVAEVALLRFGQHPALLVTRFDRKQVDKTQVLRYVIDACQALNLPSEYKYERNFGSSRDVQHIREGASLPKLFALCQKSEYPAVEMKRMLDYVLFNLCINNHDAHAKNFSFFLSKKGIQLTPAYDLINIAVYPQFDQDMAMALGNEFESQIVNAYQLADFADSCHVSRRLLVHRLMFISKRLLASIDNADFSGFIETKEEFQFVVKLMNNIRTRCQHLSKEAEAVVGMDI